MACYAPNGTRAGDSSFAPCNSVGGQASMCCAINKPDADTCLPNGVCRWVTNGQIQYFRNLCSDSTWDSPYCLNVCTGVGETLGGLSNNARLSQCPNGSWCCGDDAENNCCSSGNTFALAATIGVSSSSSAAATSTPTSAIASSVFTSITTLPTTANSTGPSASATSSSSSDSGLSTGAQAGIGVGVALGALIAIGLVGGLIWRKKRRSHGGAPVYAEENARHELDAPPQQRMSELGPSPTKPEVYAKVAPETPRAELP